MKRTRLAEEQIVGILKEAEAGAKGGGYMARRRNITVRSHS